MEREKGKMGKRGRHNIKRPEKEKEEVEK